MFGITLEGEIKDWIVFHGGIFFSKVISTKKNITIDYQGLWILYFRDETCISWWTETPKRTPLNLRSHQVEILKLSNVDSVKYLDG